MNFYIAFDYVSYLLILIIYFSPFSSLLTVGNTLYMVFKKELNCGRSYIVFAWTMFKYYCRCSSDWLHSTLCFQGNQENRIVIYDNKIIDYINFIMRAGDFEDCATDKVYKCQIVTACYTHPANSSSLFLDSSYILCNDGSSTQLSV